MGFDAVGGRALLPQSRTLSSSELAGLLLKMGFHSIAQVGYDGKAPKNGLPKNIRFSLHTIDDSKYAHYSMSRTTVSIALQSLIQTMIQHELSQIRS